MVFTDLLAAFVKLFLETEVFRIDLNDMCMIGCFLVQVSTWLY